MVATTIEQSKNLLKLGLKPDTADVHYKYVLPGHSDKIHHVPEFGNPVDSLKWYNMGYTKSGKKPLTLEEYCVPAWSLSALLDVMPKIYNVEYDLSLIKSESVLYFAFDDCDKNIHIDVDGNTPIEAAYNMVCWLFENGYIKKED